MQGWWVEALWRKRANEAYEAGEGGRRNLGQELKLPMPAAAASLASFAHFNAPTLSVRSARLAKHWQQSPEKIFWKMVHYVLIRRCAIQHRVIPCIHPKSEQICRDYFSAQKKWWKKCVNRDDKIPREKCINHGNSLV